MDKPLTIAIDGYAGCGKSTTAKAVAAQLQYRYIDTGAMYRAITLHFLQEGHDVEAPDDIAGILAELSVSFAFNHDTQRSEVCLNGHNVAGQIRTLEVSQNVSKVSAIPEVRHFLVRQQQALGKDGGIVMDGRDIGTVVFPEAELKLFMTADLEVRARRRLKEHQTAGREASLTAIIDNMRERDQLDTTRSEGPLRQAEDAIVLDTSHLGFDEQIDRVLALARERLNHSSQPHH